MNRRHFLTGAGIAGIIGAAIKSVKAAAAPEGAVVLCESGHHEPMETYKRKSGQFAAISIGDGQGDGLRALVPCKNCGVMFAIHGTDGVGSGLQTVGAAKPINPYGAVSGAGLHEIG